MKKLILLATTILFSTITFAGHQGMPSMPTLEPKKVYIVKGDEDFDAQKGFGDEESMTRMMNLMMVEGSGFEGMDMNAMKVTDNKTAPKTSHTMIGMSQTDSVKTDFPYQVEIVSSQEAKVGSNTIEFSVKDKAKEVKGLKLKAQVYMTSMDMGKEELKVKEMGAGKYQVQAQFIMKGPWAVKIISSDHKEKILNFDINSK